MSQPPQRHRVGTAAFYSPLRYPGGKRKLANFLTLVFRTNGLLDGNYVEVYAGGGAVALALLYGDYAQRIYLNDLDRGVYAFWMACRDHTDELCRLVNDAPLTVEEWDRQRMVQVAINAEPLELAFSTLYLNRVNRSGVLTGGIIGGRQQTGKWKMGARYNRRDLVRRIERIGRWRSRIEVYNLDGAVFLRDVAPHVGAKTLVYLDPPYYSKGQDLYRNVYEPRDHAKIAKLVRKLPMPWMVSYDDQPEVRALYRGRRLVTYDIAYGASVRYKGREVVFFSDGLEIPDVSDPAKLSVAQVARFLRGAPKAS
ncbi:MAG: DNA adenine methylase [Acidimicrobiales bacterium]